MVHERDLRSLHLSAAFPCPRCRRAGLGGAGALRGSLRCRRCGRGPRPQGPRSGRRRAGKGVTSPLRSAGAAVTPQSRERGAGGASKNNPMLRGSVRGGPGGLGNPHTPGAAAVSAGQRPCLGGGAGARQGRARSVCQAIFSRAGSRRGRPAASGWFPPPPPPPAPPPRARRSPAGAALSGAAPRLRGATATPPPRPAPGRPRSPRRVLQGEGAGPAGAAAAAATGAASFGTGLPEIVPRYVAFAMGWGLLLRLCFLLDIGMNPSVSSGCEHRYFLPNS